MIINILTIIIVIGCLITLVYLFQPTIHDLVYPYKYYGDIDMEVDYARAVEHNDTEDNTSWTSYEVTLKYEDISINIEVDKDLFNKCLSRKVRYLPIILFEKKDKYEGILRTEEVEKFIKSIPPNKDMYVALYNKYLKWNLSFGGLYCLIILIVVILFSILMFLT